MLLQENELNTIKEGLLNREVVSFKINDDDIIKKIKLLDIKNSSYMNLFGSYINSTTEEANKINLQKFLDEYVQTRLDYDELLRDITKSYIGDELYNMVLEYNRVINISPQYNTIIIR